MEKLFVKYLYDNMYGVVMSLFAQIGEHQICETGILIAFKDLSRQKIIFPFTRL